MDLINPLNLRRNKIDMISWHQILILLHKRKFQTGVLLPMSEENFENVIFNLSFRIKWIYGISINFTYNYIFLILSIYATNISEMHTLLVSHLSPWNIDHWLVQTFNCSRWIFSLLKHFRCSHPFSFCCKAY